MEKKEYDNFIFYGSIRKSMEALPENYRDRYLKAVIIFGTEGIVLDEDPIILALLQSLAPNIERAKGQYLIRTAKRRVELENELGKEGLEAVQKKIQLKRANNKNSEKVAAETEPNNTNCSSKQSRYGPSIR